MGPLRQAQHVERPLRTRLDGLDGVILVMRWRRWACQVVDLVHLQLMLGGQRSEARWTKGKAKAAERKVDCCSEQTSDQPPSYAPCTRVS